MFDWLALREFLGFQNRKYFPYCTLKTLTGVQPYRLYMLDFLPWNFNTLFMQTHAKLISHDGKVIKGLIFVGLFLA